ncbi:hypothetical protein [Luteolibacter luteus]|uniref:Type VI secretion system tube protein Hcp n=1 Tax=Luteolibacter luteus TaxID=2728835 RepID=A0A858RJH9_9BACT|nr:hypothetical protein [Luteolibacter luteus]QJE97426.1 type VI secretion system tube protein Hcp [Luteolibacter luteus]
MTGRRSVMGVAVAWMLSFAPALAFDTFLQISSNGKPLPSDNTHGWVEVLGFSHGSDVDLGLGGLPGKMEPKKGILQIAQDRTIVSMMDALLRGQRRDLLIQVPQRQANRVTVFNEVQFKDCYFTKIGSSLNEGDDLSIFSIEFIYSQILWTVTIPNASGSEYLAVGTGYDIAEAIPIDRGTVTSPVPGAYAGASDDGDVDNDGIPDAWETANGLDPGNATDANQDRDGDGFSNRDEYLAGTNPSSGTSFFRAVVNGPGTSGGSDITLSWSSVAGKTYTILATQDLAQPFLPIGSVTASGTQSTFPTSLAAGRFFKLSVGE